MGFCNFHLCIIARLAARARRQGHLKEADCKVLPRSSKHASDVAKVAEQRWAHEKRLWKVVWAEVKWRVIISGILLFVRGSCNAFALPLLLKQTIDAVVEGDRDRALTFIGFIMVERVCGSMIEIFASQRFIGHVPTALLNTLGSLVVRKAAAPGVQGVHKSGVDPVAFFGRELTLAHGKTGMMFCRGLVALPTLLAGSATLLLLLGWPALLGILWILSTVRTSLWMQSRAKRHEAKMSSFASERMGLLGSILGAIKAIKYFTWEPDFMAELASVRANECGALRNKARMSSMSTTLGKLTPVTGSLMTFVTFSLLGNQIKASDIFACNSVFMTMRFSVGASSMLLEYYKSMQLVFQRADKLLRLPENAPRTMMETAGEKVLATVSDLSVSFEGGSYKLHAGDIQLGHRGQLTAICGAVGSGKSTLMNSLVSAVEGDVLISGSAAAAASVGWCPQRPFIMSGTILENILLGREYNESKVTRCIADSCFGRDLELLQGGIEEVVGERGTTLSGGQQARLSLARALYDDPPLLLLDDPLAAVDAAVGRALLQALRSRCGKGQDDASDRDTSALPAVVMVLNQLPLLPNFDNVVFIEDGHARMCGSLSKAQEDKAFAQFLSNIEFVTLPAVSEEDKQFEMEHRLSAQAVAAAAPKQAAAAEAPLQSKASDATAGGNELVKKEVVATGLVSWSVIREYLLAPGLPFLLYILILFIVTYALLGLRDWWLSHWADEGGGDEPHLVAGFVAFSVAHIVASVFGVMGIATFAKRAGERLHSDSIEYMMHAPMSFFDATPAGRITSRFGADLGMVDNMMFNQLDFTMTFGFTFLVMCGTVIAKMPLMAILFAIAGVLSVPVVHGLIIFQQDIKRHSNTAMSPILSNLGETQRGAALSSVLGCSTYFIERHFKSCDAWSHLVDSALVTTLMAELWCQLLHLVVLAAVGAFTIHDMDNLRRSPGLIAMYFSYAALWGIFAAITMGVLMGLFTNMTSLERLLEYKLGGLAQEPAWSKASDPASTAWPTSGVVQFDNISLRYREGLPLALADLTLDVGGQEKLGIVGRTGAGKSSITSVLFRLVDCECGRVLIDGVDICGLGVHTLRRAISMIPQEPIVMSGTIRYNLDPFGKHSEEELLRVMSDAGLSSALSLDTAAGGGGASLSAGQRQLVTFGRTLLQGTRLVVMDEPTASVDMQTDRLLQSVARVAFAKKTVMTIAHRLETVRDCDRIAVMEAGRLVELGPPEELLNDPKSHLAKMYRASGETGGQTNGEREVDSELKEVMEFMI